MGLGVDRATNDYLRFGSGNRPSGWTIRRVTVTSGGVSEIEHDLPSVGASRPDFSAES